TELTYPKIDILSILLSTVGFGGIVFGFSNAGEAAGWSSPKVIIGLAAGVIGLILFVMRQLKLKVPMLDMRP
ncbi:MFS transporter, partial [Bacillus haynesii]|nr:MFS transporter [Bacillus haynesii]